MPTPKEGLTILKVADIKVGEHRKDTGDLVSLANSIRANGLINAIVVDRKEITTETTESGTVTVNEWWLASGYRRLEAVKRIGWEEIEVRLYEKLSPFERKQVELEEELAQKKARTWQEEVEIKRQLHELFLQEKSAANPTRKQAGPHNKKIWRQSDSAERLGIPTQTFSEDLRLADALKQFPDLKNAGTKKDAVRKMYAMRELALLQSISKQMRSKGIEIHEDVELQRGDAYALLKALPSSSFDCCITDPPWGIEIQKAGSARSNDYADFKDTADVWDRFLNEALPEIFRILKDGSHFWLFYGPEFYQKTRDALEKVGFDARYVPCVWIKEKPNYTDTEYKPMPQYESFFFAAKHSGTDVAPRRLMEATSDVFVYSRTPEGRIHRTEKPLDLIRRLISLSTVKGDRIIDPFAGSASTLCASLMLRRKALGFEFDEGMFEAAQGRLQALRVDIGEEVEGEEEMENDKKEKAVGS
jgi:site-specific DNA-methyltransferase (adenine-specific)